MDQPPNPPGDKFWDWIITGAVGIAGIVGTWITTKIKANADITTKAVEAEPSIQKENIEWSEGIISNWRDEIAAIRKETREEIAKERARADEERRKREEWQERAMACESRVPFLELQIEQLKARVTELEKQIAAR